MSEHLCAYSDSVAHGVAAPLKDQPTLPMSPSPAEVCRCGHDLGGHDGIATRYCQATVSGALARGCVCAPLVTTTAPEGLGDARGSRVASSLGSPSHTLSLRR